MQMTIIEAVHVLNPAALERARRLQYAVSLLRSGTARRDASGLVQRQYGCSQPTAWRLVCMAADLVLIEVPK